ncbi:uncharacterized protein LOC133657647 [Entelurus aequoreus]|uniref:uncharacterized protein LOC133657647 n=1 Tax=Entelurus aequoreus TaxID=161455 RepID=UPI002B1E3FA6|nr:uncharacterized protein LOC133657647 [Entelurus aequoreus]
MEVLPNNMVRLETLDGKHKHMMTPYASLKPLRSRTHPGWPKDSSSAPVLPGDAEMLTSSSEEETECHCFTDHTYAGPTSPWKKGLHPDQKQLLEYVLACDRPAMELIVKEGGVCLTREEFWSLGLSRDMDSTGKDVFIAKMYIVPTWKHKDVDPMSSLPRDAHLKDALLFPAWSKHNGPEHYLLCVLRPAKREILLLDSQFALWPSGFGDEVYRAIFRSLYNNPGHSSILATFCSSHVLVLAMVLF